MPNDEHDQNVDQTHLNELITLREAAELTGLSHSHLRLLVRKGDIWGKKMGRDWLTTAQSVYEYQAHDRKPGPLPKHGNQPGNLGGVSAK